MKWPLVRRSSYDDAADVAQAMGHYKYGLIEAANGRDARETLRECVIRELVLYGLSEDEAIRRLERDDPWLMS